MGQNSPQLPPRIQASRPTPSRQAGFFYNIRHGHNPKWHRIFSDVNDCPQIDPDSLDLQMAADPIGFRQDFLREFIQPADRLTDAETVRRMLRTDIDQWYFEPIFHDQIPAPKPVTEPRKPTAPRMVTAPRPSVSRYQRKQSEISAP